MVQKIRAIKKAAPSLVIVARTDARAVESLESAMTRAKAYVEAGADAIFPEALTIRSGISSILPIDFGPNTCKYDGIWQNPLLYRS